MMNKSGIDALGSPAVCRRINGTHFLNSLRNLPVFSPGVKRNNILWNAGFNLAEKRNTLATRKNYRYCFIRH